MPDEWKTGELGDPVDPWEDGEPKDVEFSTVGLTPVTPAMHETVVDPGKTVVEPGTATAKKPRQKKRRRRPIVVLILVVSVGTGGTAWVLTPWYESNNNQAAVISSAPASPPGPTPAASASESAFGTCQDASNWSMPAQQAWLKEVTTPPPTGSGTVQFKQTAAGNRLCAGLPVTVDYWAVNVHDKGDHIRTFFDRFAYSVTRIRSTEIVVNGQQPLVVKQDGSWGTAQKCSGRAVTVAVGGTPGYSAYQGGMNPLLGFHFPEGASLAMQSVKSPRRLHGCK